MHFNFIQYMQNVANTLKLITGKNTGKRFYRMSALENIDEILQSGIGTTVPSIAAVDNPDGKFADNMHDNITDRQFYVFMIFDRASSLDVNQQENAKKNIKDIASKIISKLRHDHLQDYETGNTHGLSNLQTSSITYRTYGPFADNLYGMIVSFTVLNPAQVAYNPADWDE